MKFVIICGIIEEISYKIKSQEGMICLKKLMLGNEAVARGAYEAGCSVVSSYPGTPSTEITENIVKYDKIYV